jgi:hypothetical protein
MALICKMIRTTGGLELIRQLGAQGNDFSHPIVDQAAFGGIVDVGFHDERIGTIRQEESESFHP